MGSTLSRLICCCLNRYRYDDDDDYVNCDDALDDLDELKAPLRTFIQLEIWQFMMAFNLIVGAIVIVTRSSGWYAWGSFAVGILLMVSAMLGACLWRRVYQGKRRFRSCQLRAYFIINMAVFVIFSLPALITTGIGGVAMGDDISEECKNSYNEKGTAIYVLIVLIMGVLTSGFSMCWSCKFSRKLGLGSGNVDALDLMRRDIFSVDTIDRALRTVQTSSPLPSRRTTMSLFRRSTRRRNRQSISSGDDVARQVGTDVARLMTVLESAEEQPLTVDRYNIVDHLLNIYADPIVMHRQIKVQFQGELGDDFGGLTKDMFTQFWKNVRDDCFTGYDVMVPCLQIHRNPNIVMTSIGRIISHMLMILGKVPYKFCRSSLLAACAPDVEICQDLLLEDFLLYVDEDKRPTLRRAIGKVDELTDDDMEALTNLFMVYDMRVLPSKEILREQLATIAKRELCDKPMFLLIPLGTGLRTMEDTTEFWDSINEEKIRVLFTRELPTGIGVISCLKPDRSLENLEKKSYSLLKKYLEDAELSVLIDFLVMVTGCSDLPDDDILVTFNDTFGTARRPCFHTCGNVLSLPTSYETFEEFKTEMDAILSNKENLEMTFR